MNAPRPSLPAGTGLIWLESVDSTNEEARRRALAGETGRLWIVAQTQTSGRGRRGRSWSGGAGNLFASYLCAPGLAPEAAAQLSFAAALAVAETLDLYLPKAAMLKWPNDVLIDERKAAGILLEAAGGGVGVPVRWLTIGIGINLAIHPEGTEYPAISLASAGVPAPPVSEALEALAGALARWIGIHGSEGFAPLRAAWLARAHGLGKPIAVRTGRETYTGIFSGLDAKGALLLAQPDGRLKSVSAGEVFFADDLR